MLYRRARAHTHTHTHTHTHIHSHTHTSHTNTPSYLSRVDHHWKIRARKQRTDIGKYCFVKRSITDWNQLPEGAIFSKGGLG